MFALVDRPIDLAALDRAVRDPKAGAVVTFVGTTRNVNAGRSVRRLEYEAFASMATKEMRSLAAQAKKGIVAVRSSRVPTGRVGRNVEVNDDELGFVASLELNPQKARVLLRLALTKTKDAKQIQRYFDQY